MEGIENVKQELETKRLELKREAEAARREFLELEADLKRVDDALAALTQSKRPSRSQPRKEVATREELQQHIAAARQEAPSVDDEGLKRAVRARVQASGKSMSRFASLYAQALSSCAPLQASWLGRDDFPVELEPSFRDDPAPHSEGFGD